MREDLRLGSTHDPRFAMSRRHMLGALDAGAMLGRGARAAEPVPADLMPLFWRAWDGSHRDDEAGRVAALARSFFLPCAGWYDAAGFDGAGTHGRLLDERVGAWIARLDPIVAQTRALSAALPSAWDAHLRRFAAAGLEGSGASAEACFMPSLLEFTGYSRIWQGRPVLFLAPDAIAAQPAPATDLAVLIDHEAFHLYHDTAAPDVAGPLVWMRLWREGLATLASAALNPRATPAQLLMSVPLAQATAADVAAGARATLVMLDSHGDGTLFDLGRGAG